MSNRTVAGDKRGFEAHVVRLVRFFDGVPRACFWHGEFFPFEEDYTSRRIKEFSADGQFAFVEGSTTGLPVKELSVVDTPQETQHLPEVRATKGKVLPSLGRTPVWNDIPVSPDRIMGVNAIGHVTQGGLPATHQRLIPGTTGTEGKEIYLSTALSWT